MRRLKTMTDDYNPLVDQFGSRTPWIGLRAWQQKYERIIRAIQTATGIRLTADTKRCALILDSVQKYVADMNEVKGLGFCVSVAHADYMAAYFNRHGVPSVSLSAKSVDDIRDDAKADSGGCRTGGDGTIGCALSRDRREIHIINRRSRINTEEQAVCTSIFWRGDCPESGEQTWQTGDLHCGLQSDVYWWI